MEENRILALVMGYIMYGEWVEAENPPSTHIPTGV